MKFSELKQITEPAMNELFTSLLSIEEQKQIQGSGISTIEGTNTPIICLSLRKGDNNAQIFIDKWNNKIILGIQIKVDVRGIAKG